MQPNFVFWFFGQNDTIFESNSHFNLSETTLFVADLAPQQKSQHDDVSFNTQN